MSSPLSISPPLSRFAAAAIVHEAITAAAEHYGSGRIYEGARVLSGTADALRERMPAFDADDHGSVQLHMTRLLGAWEGINALVVPAALFSGGA